MNGESETWDETVFFPGATAAEVKFPRDRDFSNPPPDDPQNTIKGIKHVAVSG